MSFNGRGAWMKRGMIQNSTCKAINPAQRVDRTVEMSLMEIKPDVFEKKRGEEKNERGL